MHCCLHGKAKKKEFLEVAFAECNDHCTRRRDFIKNKINFFVECQDRGTQQRDFFKKNFAERRGCGT
jgi:hypothetical protein